MKQIRTALALFVLMLVLTLAGLAHLRAAADATVGMAIIEDLEGDRIAVEPTSGEVWGELVELYNTEERLWIGGVVEVFIFIRPDPNYPWGFRFKPESITVAEVTAEGLQTAIRDISENVDYWIRVGRAYVFARVMEIHERGETGDITGPNGYPDGKSDMRDVGGVGRAYGAIPGDSEWNSMADINDDRRIDMRDLGVVARNFGQSW